MSRVAQHASVWILAPCSVAVLLTFDGMLSADRVPFYRDLLFFFVPFKHFLGESLRRGEVPLWNPWVFMGTPFLAGLQTCVLYPPSLLLLLPFPLGLNLFALFHYLAAMAGAYGLLRGRGLSVGPSGIGAVVFASGGYLASMLNVASALQAAAWAPWVFLCWSRLLERRSISAALGFVLSSLLQLLAGFPENFLMTIATVGAWTAYRQTDSWAHSLRQLTLLAALLALVAGLAAFQLLPTVEYVGQSVRRSGFPFEEASDSSLRPASLAQLLLPRTAAETVQQHGGAAALFEESRPWILSLYFGLVPLCLAVAGATASREQWFWTALTVVSLLGAFGKHSPIFAAVYSLAPWAIGKFRFPEKFFFLVHLATMVLVADGAERLIRGERATRRICWISASTFVAIGGAILWARWTAPKSFLDTISRLAVSFGSGGSTVDLAEDITYKALRLVTILTAFIGVTILANRSLLSRSALAVVIFLLTSGDLVIANRKLNPTVSWPELRSQALLVDASELRKTHQRIFHYNTTAALSGEPVAGLDQWWKVSHGDEDLESFVKGLWTTLFIDAGMVEGFGTISGSDGIERDSDAKMRRVLSIVPRETAIKLLRLYAVRFLIGPAPLESPFLERRISTPSSTYFSYRVRETMPIAYLADQLRLTESMLDAFNRLIAPDFRLDRQAVVEKLPSGWSDRGAGEGYPGSVEIIEHENDRVLLRADAMHRCLLVLSESDYPGWLATVDGNLATIIRTNALVRGVDVPAGSHLVEFTYRPESFRRGVWVTTASAAILLLICLRAPWFA